MTGMIVLDGVGRTYPDGTVAVADLSFEIAEGELVCLVGPSGCGKTTTLKMINRLIEPTAGRILVAGEDVRALNPVQLRRRIGYVIQQVGLFPHLTVRGNVGCVPRLLRWPRAKVRTRVDELLELVGLDPAVVGPRYPHELSGGQQQRVGVARALAADPPVLLMDEPFSAIDPVTRERLQDEFARLRREIGKTIVFVTHDLDEAIRLADRVAVFRAGTDLPGSKGGSSAPGSSGGSSAQGSSGGSGAPGSKGGSGAPGSGGGRLEQIDTPARLLAAPATPFVIEFTGAERTLRRLDVTPVRLADLEPAPAGTPTGPAPVPGQRTVVVGAPLSQALTALLAQPDARLPVYAEPDGDAPARVAGYLTPAALHAALRPAG